MVAQITKNKKRNKMKLLRLASVLVLASLVGSICGFSNAAYAAGGTATWTDATGDHKFSTAGNWAENALPEDGDELVFDTIPAGSPTPYVVDNDVATVFSGVESQGSIPSPYTYVQLQNDLNLQNGATWNVPSWNKLYVRLTDGKKVIVAGDFNLIAGRIADIQVSGKVTAKSGATLDYSMLSSGAAEFVVENGASIGCFNADFVVTAPVTFGGGSDTTLPNIIYQICAGGFAEDPAVTLTLNNVTLLSDTEVGVYTNDTVKILALNSNSKSLTLATGADGTLVTPSGTQTVTYVEKTTQLDGDKPDEDVTVYPLETAILNGSRCYVTVRETATLKGEGTLCYLSSAGTVTPGNSPGTITITSGLMLNSTSKLVIEVASVSSYDKLVAGGVDLFDANLDLQFLSGATVAAGDAYTIISNTGTDPVNGTFLNLPEGTTFNAMGGTFKISYVGGDGNDVVITVVSVPTVPNTGGMVLKTNPVMILGVAAAAAVLLMAMGRFAHKRL